MYFIFFILYILSWPSFWHLKAYRIRERRILDYLSALSILEKRFVVHDSAVISLDVNLHEAEISTEIHPSIIFYRVELDIYIYIIFFHVISRSNGFSWYQIFFERISASDRASPPNPRIYSHHVTTLITKTKRLSAAATKPLSPGNKNVS